MMASRWIALVQFTKSNSQLVACNYEDVESNSII